MASARILHSRSLSCHPRCHTSFGTRQQRHVYSPTQLPRDVKQSVGSGKTTEFGKRLDFGANAAFKDTSDIPSRGCCPSRPSLLW
ncbi:hypothetical protein D0861_04777 [Hortaea werneckii]|uniref:Uncharacterized protein n=1 Tax=Hortaea werneckii TaxID=91943 RepID=A0A3M7FI18_HORWE|nr:hypothetical protein D0861_04777 [Hortaea werneckii]